MWGQNSATHFLLYHENITDKYTFVAPTINRNLCFSNSWLKLRWKNESRELNTFVSKYLILNNKYKLAYVKFFKNNSFFVEEVKLTFEWNFTTFDTLNILQLGYGAIAPYPRYYIICLSLFITVNTIILSTKKHV